MKSLPGEKILTELSTRILNVAVLSQTLADLYAGLFYSIWTVYWVTGVFLNYIIVVYILNFAELSQALLQIYMQDDFELSVG